MATIEKRISADGKESYRVKIRMHGSKSVSGTFDRKTDAKRWAAETETAIKHGKYFQRVEAQQHTVANMIDRYCREVLPSKRKNTQIGQVPQFAWWKEEIGALALSSVTPARLTECKSKLAKSKDGIRSPTTIKRYMAALSHAFTIAVKDWQWLEQNPFRLVTYPSEPRGRVRFLSDDERTALLTECQKNTNPYLYPIVLLALSTGARKNEILSLCWKNVNLATGLITLEDTKNGERRSIPVRGAALDVLKQVPKRINCALVFPNAAGTDSYRIRPDWEAAVVAARLKDFTFHDLRHSCASYLAMSGATLGEIAAVLGHKTLAMVKRYSHIGEQHTASVIERMNTKFLRGTNNEH